MEKWFDPTVYMQNKLAQMQATDPAYAMSDLVAAFAKAGFVGPEGYFQHFQQFGAAEEVAPNAYFNANEYYAAKAAQFYGDKFDGSELQIAQVKTLINKEGMNAWTHYQQFGSAEGVNPSNAFDASDYCAAKAEAMIKAGQKAPDGTDWTAEKIAKAIDDAGMSVLEHYMTYAGTGEGEVAAGSTYPVDDDDQVVVPNPGVNVVVDGSAITYNGTAGDDTFYLEEHTELAEYNTLDGGEGNDTLILSDDKFVNGATIQNIENLVVRGGDERGLYDMASFSTSFTLEGGDATLVNVTNQKLIADAAKDLVVNMADGQTSVDLVSLNREVLDQATTMYLYGDSLSSVKLAVDDSFEDVKLVNDLSTKVTDLDLTVANTFDSFADVDVTAMRALTTVTVAGAGELLLNVNEANAALKTVDATANTGGVAVDLSAVSADAVFKGGAGDDVLILDDSTAAAHTMGAGDDLVIIDAKPTSNDFAVDGGEGTDTLMMTADIAADFNIGNVVTNFETLYLDGGAGDVDMDYFGDINHVIVDGLDGALNVNNVDNGGTIEYADGNSQGVTVEVKGAAGGEADVLNVTLATAFDAFDAGNLKVDNVEIVNITADGTDMVLGDTYALNLSADATATVTVSGDAHLALDLTGAAEVTTIDASANTAGVGIKNDLGATVTFKGGAGADAISAAALNGVPVTADDVLTFDGFAAGDGIKMGDTAEGALTKLEVYNTDNWSAVLNKIEDGALAWFQYDGNTYVAVSGTNGFGVADLDGNIDDYLVKLNGLVDLTDAAFDAGVLGLPEGA